MSNLSTSIAVLSIDMQTAKTLKRKLNLAESTISLSHIEELILISLIPNIKLEEALLDQEIVEMMNSALDVSILSDSRGAMSIVLKQPLDGSPMQIEIRAITTDLLSTSEETLSNFIEGGTIDKSRLN